MTPFAIQIIPSAIFWIGVFFVPESSRWLISRYRREEAEEQMAYVTILPKDHEFVQYELLLLEANRDSRREKYGEGMLKQMKTIFTTKEYITRLDIFCIYFHDSELCWYQRCHLLLCHTDVQSIGHSGSSSKLLSAGVFGVFKTLAAIFCLSFSVESRGRRSLFLYGCIPYGITMRYLGAYIYIVDPSKKLAKGRFN